MCTVTVLRAVEGAARPDGVGLVRLVFNRDEQRSRPPSSGPERRRVGKRTAIMPIDPPSGGTWIGANDAGLVACVLNSNPRDASRTARPGPSVMSRGTIVPSLLSAGTMCEALSLARVLDASQFEPFRVLVVSADSFFVVCADGERLTHSEPRALRSPVFLTSSGLGDKLVEQPRRELFDEMLREKPDAYAAQECFHRHRWEERAHISVLMSRVDACTVCRCVVDVFADSVVLSHSRLKDSVGDAAPAKRLELQVRETEVVA